jgi:hypothetical protein
MKIFNNKKLNRNIIETVENITKTLLNEKRKNGTGLNCSNGFILS